MANWKDYIKFYLKMILQQPYWGAVLRARQMWPTRAPHMKGLIKNEIQRSSASTFKVLEVGSWAGTSACLWAQACKEAGTGEVHCVDSWAASDNAPEDMKAAVKGDRIYKLFLHNVKCCGVKDYIHIHRGLSDEMASKFEPESFDVVYIDGDHAYTQFKKDLLSYQKFLKNGGVICGDDLELDPNTIDLDNARAHAEEDYILDPKNERNFHPGVALGVLDVFGSVSTVNGFWAMRKNGDQWDQIPNLAVASE